MLRQLDEAILWHLVAQFPERRDDIVRAFEQVLASVPLTPAEPRLLGVTTVVARLLDNKVVLEQAEPPLKDALAASPVPGIAGRSEATRGRALEALGRLHLAQGQVDLAARELGEALELSPMLAHAPIALAELDVKRGNRTAALDRYQLAAISGRMKVADEAALRTLYREVHGSDANLEADLDRLYDKRFPNPITPKRYEPPTTGVKRVVLRRALHRIGMRSLRFGGSVVGRAPRALPRQRDCADRVPRAHTGSRSNGRAWCRRPPVCTTR